MSQYPDVIDLDALDGNNGFKIGGGAVSDGGGFSVSAGDINGDGFTDLIMGAPFTDGASGAAYVVFGAASGIGAFVDLADLAGKGFAVTAPDVGQLGRSVAFAGDVNGDGFGDFIVGAYAADPNGDNSGSSYVVFGSSDPFPDDFDPTTLDGHNGFRLDGAADFDGAGFAVSSAGDVNGDGYGDLIIGAPFADPGGNYSGAAYVVFGKGTDFAAHVNLSNLNGTSGFKISGIANYDQTGFSVDSAGDINGDGFDDLLVSVPYADPGSTDRAGLTYVIFGKNSGFHRNLNLAHFHVADGFTIRGEAVRDYAGSSVSSAGDFNGDGFADLIIGAPSADPNGNYSGAAYVVFGKAAGFGNIDLATLGIGDGFKISGAASPDRTGWTVSGAGDFNGDGFGDIIVGATGPDDYAGASYILFGRAKGFAHGIDVSHLNGNNGIVLVGGASHDRSGTSASAAGDVNGDGFADVIVGAWGADSYAGASYVVFGSAPGEGVTRAGSTIGQTIHGGEFNDTLSGLGGNDVLIGNGGADVLIGGTGKDALLGGDGNDRLQGGAARDTLDGGAGSDTFVFAHASDSTGITHDIVRHADFAADFFDVNAAVGGIDDTVVSGTLSKASFDTELGIAVGADELAIGHAVLFTPDDGNLATHTFLIVDLNGEAGYQKGGDIVIELVAPKHLDALSTEDFPT